MALVPGSNAGPYRIVEPLGRGGMASVYRAYEPKLDRYVALKVLPREFLHDPSFAQRFRQEAQVVAKLEHPNIIPIYAYDIEEQDGIPWMAMRLVPAGSLAELIRRGRLPLARSVAILRSVADALDYAHAKGIVHRDVKPQNVLLDDAGRVYLADFGIAKILESAGGLTASGMITGTPQYMAPEQATGLKIGPAADVYALGIVAYEMFTGRVPFAADTPVAVLMKHVQEPLPLPPPDVVPEPLLRALLKATTKKPEDRWPTAGAFTEALASGLAAPHSARVAAATVAIPRTLAPETPDTIVSPVTTPAPPGTPPPQAARPPVLRAPVARDRQGTRSGNTHSGTFLAGLGVLGVLALLAVLTSLWLWQRGRDGSGPNPAPTLTPAPARPTTRAAAPPSPTAPTPTPTARPASSQPSPRTPDASRAAAAPPVPESRSERASASPVATPTPSATPPPSVAPPAAPTVDPEISRLAAALADRDIPTRRRAAQELASRGPLAAPAVPELVAALADRSPDVRLRAAEALGRVGPAAAPATSALVRALRDADALVPAEAAKALGLLGEPAAEAAGALGAALGHRDVAVRREAARALARLGRSAEPALAELVAALSDKDKTVCSQSARALGRIGAAARPAVPQLTVLSRSPDVLVSREAQGALDGIGRQQP